MKLAAALFFLLLSPVPARAESALSLEARDTLASRVTLFPGDVLTFPAGFDLTDFHKDRSLAASILTGHDPKGRAYACAFAMEAVSEVRFTEASQWTVVAIGIGTDLQTLVLQNAQWGVARPLAFRCTGAIELPGALLSKGVKLFESVPVELVNERVPASPEAAFPDLE